MKIKKAVIVAAGKSSRLYPRTIDCPKGLLKIHDKAIIEYSINSLKKNGIKDIAIVTGFKSEMFQEKFGNSVTQIFNPFYAQCNNLGSLWFAKEFINDEPIIYLHSDLMYDEKILANAIAEFEKRNDDYQLIVDYKKTDEEAMKASVDKNKYLIESKKEIPIEKADGEWMGIALIRNTKDVIKYFEKVLKVDGLNYYDTFAFNQMVEDGYKFYCSPTSGLNWIEIDFEADFIRASETF